MWRMKIKGYFLLSHSLSPWWIFSFSAQLADLINFWIYFFFFFFSLFQPKRCVHCGFNSTAVTLVVMMVFATAGLVAVITFSEHTGSNGVFAFHAYFHRSR